LKLKWQPWTDTCVHGKRMIVWQCSVHEELVMPLDPKTTRILLLDDDPFMLKILVRMLARLGFTQVVGYDSGQQALQKVTEPHSRVDLIFLDINMPGMDGIEFIRRLVECQYRGSVVLVSGENNRMLESVEKLIETQQLKALGHLQKPVQQKELASLLSRIEPVVGREVLGRAARQAYDIDELRAAVTNGELVNYYQPKVALTTGEVVGVESLVRWQHPRDGLVFPDQFIALAEEYGLIRDVTRAVLAAAMKQAKLWRQAGHDLPIAVNVSMDDMTALDFPDVAAALAESVGIEPRVITLEVTEGKVMKQLSTVLDVLSRLRLKRFRLSIDDFGTGHSSLAQLRDLPFDELKVDRGFVHGAAADPTLQAICNASVRMAHQLRLQVVAEGIENQSDWDILRELGCDIGQGYLMARPMPAVDMTGWIAAWEARKHGSIPLKA
jgi:EAL domain-containing protein (putative c-di-GMP-specific phosphodiesterase class I)/ActR/RegA family two-component response regulator